MKKEIVIVSGSDWQGLYLNGHLAQEDHKLSVEDVLEALGIEYQVQYPNEIWLEDSGSLPEHFDEVVTIDQPYGSDDE